MNQEELFEHLKALETELATSATRKNVSRIDQIISDDFTEIGKSGRFFDKEGIMAMLKEEEAYQIAMSHFEFKCLSDDVVLVKYRTSAAGISAVRTSIWKRYDSVWKINHHQGTAIK